jgi:hypothetical protein
VDGVGLVAQAKSQPASTLIRFWQLATLALNWIMMSRLVPLTHLPFALAAVFISLGSMVAGRTDAADQSKGAECAELDDPAARLACFDAAFPRAPRAGSPSPATVAVATAAPAAEARNLGSSATQVDAIAPIPAQPPVTVTTAAVATDAPAAEARNFGLSAEQIEANAPKPPQPPVTATTAAVTTVRRLPSGYLLIGLDNDQSWQQTQLDSHIWLQPGDRVTIRRATMGSYLLETPAHYSTRVRRLQ